MEFGRCCLSSHQPTDWKVWHKIWALSFHTSRPSLVLRRTGSNTQMIDCPADTRHLSSPRVNCHDIMEISNQFQFSCWKRWNIHKLCNIFFYTRAVQRGKKEKEREGERWANVEAAFLWQRIYFIIPEDGRNVTILKQAHKKFHAWLF